MKSDSKMPEKNTLFIYATTFIIIIAVAIALILGVLGRW